MLVSAISAQTTLGIVIQLGTPDLSLVCAAQRFSEEQNELKEIAEKQFLSVKKAIRTLNQTARSSGVKVKKFANRIRKTRSKLF